MKRRYTKRTLQELYDARLAQATALQTRAPACLVVQAPCEDSIPQASVDENRIVLNRAGSIALSLISLRKELEEKGGTLSARAADNLLNVCQTLGFAESMVNFVLGEANL